MDENQFRILMRVLEQMQRSIGHIAMALEQRDRTAEETQRLIHSIGSTLTYLRALKESSDAER